VDVQPYYYIKFYLCLCPNGYNYKNKLKAHLSRIIFPLFLSTQPCTCPVDEDILRLLSEMNDFNYITKLCLKKEFFFSNLITSSLMITSLNYFINIFTNIL